MEKIDTTAQFIGAVKALRSRGFTNLGMCREMGIDRSNFLRVMREPERHTPSPQWLSLLCSCFGVSPAYLLLARGGVFGDE